MAFLVKAMFLWNESLATFLQFFVFSVYREILRNTIYMPSFRSIGPFKQKLQGGGEGTICPLWPCQCAKSSACLELNFKYYSIFTDTTGTIRIEKKNLKEI